MPSTEMSTDGRISPAHTATPTTLSGQPSTVSDFKLKANQQTDRHQSNTLQWNVVPTNLQCKKLQEFDDDSKIAVVLANDGEGIMEGVVEEALEVSRVDRVRPAVRCAHPAAQQLSLHSEHSSTRNPLLCTTLGKLFETEKWGHGVPVT